MPVVTAMRKHGTCSEAVLGIHVSELVIDVIRSVAQIELHVLDVLRTVCRIYDIVYAFEFVPKVHLTGGR